MIDALVILFSAGMCLFIAWRAVKLDAVLPWFGPEKPVEAAEDGARGWRARAGRQR